MNNRKIWLTGGLAAGIVFLLPTVTSAQAGHNQAAGNSPRVAQGSLAGAAAIAPEDTADIALGGEVVMRLRGTLGGYTAQQRAGEVTQRLTPILSQPNLQPDDVQVRQLPGSSDAAIYVRDRLLVTIGWRDARANSTTPYLLAQQYVQTLRRVLPEVAPQMNTSPFTPPAAHTP
jgi:hypothetical protein